MAQMNRNVNLEEIDSDMESDKPMNRLLQGDVGSGKTVVSEIALYINYLGGYQGVLMAPTEVLANQHYEVLKEQLKSLNVEVKTILLCLSIILVIVFGIYGIGFEVTDFIYSKF